MLHARVTFCVGLCNKQTNKQTQTGLHSKPNTNSSNKSDFPKHEKKR